MIGDTTLTTHRVRYSAAYPTGRELMLEPRYGCAGEAMLRREAARSAPGGTARGRARAYRERTSLPWGLTPLCFVSGGIGTVLMKGL